jgi:hypothetical protein
MGIATIGLLNPGDPWIPCGLELAICAVARADIKSNTTRHLARRDGEVKKPIQAKSYSRTGNQSRAQIERGMVTIVNLC